MPPLFATVAATGLDPAVFVLIAAALLIVAEALVPAGGALAAIGFAALVGSGLALYNAQAETDVSVPVIATAAVLVGALGLLIVQRAYRAQFKQGVMTGWEELVGAVAEVRVALDPAGQVFVEGALWTARVPQGSEHVPAGARVRVREVDGLTLIVDPTPVDEAEPGVESPL